MASDSAEVTSPAWTWPLWTRTALALALAAGAVSVLVVGWMQTRSQVTLRVDGHSTQLLTHATTVEAALRHAGLDLVAEDLVTPDLAISLRPHMVIQVQRAQPVLLAADGLTRQVFTHATTIGELLTEVGLAPGPADEIWLGEERASLDDMLTAQPSGFRAGDEDAMRHSHSPGPEIVRQVTHRGGSRTISETQGNRLPKVTLKRATMLMLNDNGSIRLLQSTAATIGQVLNEYGITTFLGDLVRPSFQSRITEGMTIDILRSVPVQIGVDGRTIHTRTRAETVAGVLGQEGVALLGKDRVTPDLSQPVQSNLNIQVTRVREELLVEFEPIPYETVWVPDPDVEIDTVRLAQAGEIGLNKRRYRVVYEDSQEVSRILEDSWEEQPPVTKQMAYGTKIVVRTLQTPDGPIEYWRKVRVYTTSYTAASAGKPKDHPRYGYTRTGRWLEKGIVAVDPTVIPLQTWLYVPGYGRGKAADTGGGVKGKFVDLGFERHNYESWHWWTDVYILTPVPARSQIRWILPDWPKFPDRGTPDKAQLK